ncbi:hypothetical protein CLOM621_08624 [Clostridium sp. M62/1]|nr:hypothetical protein CLOM621_08624 [Clostridium sp. M62/1]
MQKRFLSFISSSTTRILNIGFTSYHSHFAGSRAVRLNMVEAVSVSHQRFPTRLSAGFTISIPQDY